MALVALSIATSSASAAVRTDQPSYAPGSAVTISGDNSNFAGYQPGETVNVNVTKPDGGTLSCSGTADANGAWSCQVTLPSNSTAVGGYRYTAAGQASGVTESGTFSDSGCSGADAVTRPSDPNVSVSYDTSGGTATYSVTSTNESPSGGVPGLIEYCVYPSALPSSAAASYLSGDGAWASGIDSSAGFFDFERPLGNPSNLPFDGTTQTVGQATWNSGIVPGDQLILLHINDAAACDSAYNTTGLSTCFITPASQQSCSDCGGGGNTSSDLTASKTANPADNLAYGWSIGKSASPALIEAMGGPSKTVNYTVTATHDSGTAGGWKVTGVITINNPNSGDASGVTVSDKILESDGSTQDPGASCNVDTSGFSGTVAGGGSAHLNYTCAYSAQPATSSETNKATINWNPTLSDSTTTPSSSAPATAGIDWSSVTPTAVDRCVAVTDAFNGGAPTALGTYCVGGDSSNVPGSVTPSYASPKWTLSYSSSVSVPTSNCKTYPNTAKFTTSDSAATGMASASVEACGPAASGALTIGFWKNSNGQNLIKSYCQNPALANYLKGLGGGSGPFSNAPTTKCGDVATYVSGILSGASATNMNAMLKAQMLSAALDAWFSGPGWTSTTSGGVKPPSTFLKHNSLGAFSMDTTSVCPMVDNLSAGTASCQNGNPSTNAVTAGAVPSSPMTMQAILDFAATTSSPFNGSTSNSIWYSGSKTLETVLKNIFDQFNNQLAFSP